MATNPDSNYKVQYCQLLVAGKLLSSDLKIDLDFGKDQSIVAKYDSTLIAKTSIVKELVNLVDALNYMTSIGWEYVESLFLQEAGGTTMGPVRYLMKYTYNQ